MTALQELSILGVQLSFEAYYKSLRPLILWHSLQKLRSHPVPEVFDIMAADLNADSLPPYQTAFR